MRYGCLWIWMLRSAALVFYSSFSAHNTSFKNTALKKKPSTDLSRDQNTICVWTQYSNSCSSSAGRFVYGPTNTWMGHICFYLFIFTLRYVIAPFRYLSRPFISAALAPALPLLPFWALNVLVALLSKILISSKISEWMSYGFGTTRGWVIIDNFHFGVY